MTTKTNQHSELAVGLVGAFERHNFGDWLMAWTFGHYIDGPSTWLTMTSKSPWCPTPARLTQFEDLAQRRYGPFYILAARRSPAQEKLLYR